MTDWKTIHSSAQTRPLEIDMASSQYYVYERKNIHQEEIEDIENESPILQWVYEERKYTKEEYENLKSATTQLLMQNLSDVAVDLAILKEVVQ